MQCGGEGRQKQRLKGGFEWDWTGRCRRMHQWKTGDGKYLKRKMNKRCRREWLREIEDDFLSTTEF